MINPNKYQQSRQSTVLVILQVAALLTAFTCISYIVSDDASNWFACRLAALELF